MKITTWNVNGIRAVSNKGFSDWAKSHDTDVLCLQEIKAMEDQFPETARNINDMTVYINPAKRPGYSGVASYYRTPPEEVKFGIGYDIFDDEGRIIKSKHGDLYLYNVYFPSGQSGSERVEFKLNFYETLLGELKKLHVDGKKIIVTGDFNTAHTEIDLANPKSNQKTSGFLPEERAMISKYLDSGFKDAYRELYPDKVEYTWWTYRFRSRERNIGWRLDYYLVSESLMENVEEVEILGDIEGSDHCPVVLTLKNQ